MLMSSYIYIPVSDMEKAADWYGKTLGVRVVYRDTLYFDLRNTCGVRIMLIPNEGGVTSQMQYAAGPQPAYGFCVKEFDALKEHLAASGVPMGQVFDYFGRSLSFFDPDGNKIEIWEDYDYAEYKM